MWRTNPRHPATSFADGQIPNSQIFPLRPLLEFLRSFLLFSFLLFYFLFFYLSRFCVGFSNFRVSFVSCSSVFVAIFIIFES